jgi:Ca-activated chloride channel homolog
MHITTHLDLDVIAVEGPEQVSLLVELTAPSLEPTAAREPGTLVVVLDRSGSMGGDRLEGAKHALVTLLDRLDPTDRFGLVTFDDEVALVAPAAPLTDKVDVRARIGAITAGGSTDLSAGYLRGLAEARRVAGPTGATLLLISDGHANAGVTDPVAMGAVAAKGRIEGVTTSTVGFGLGYDETLLGALARGGAGSELFAEYTDQAVAAIAGEIDGLLSQSAQAATLQIRMHPACRAVRLINDLPTTTTTDGVLVELGTFYSGEIRKLVLTFDVPGMPALGLAQVASLDFAWVELPRLVQHSVTVPVHVNVVPGDQAAGRIPDVVVRSELAFQQTQIAKRLATGHLSRGDTAQALSELRRARTIASDAWASNPDNESLRQEVDMVVQLLEEAEYGDPSRASKLMSSDSSFKSRTSGRSA